MQTSPEDDKRAKAKKMREDFWRERRKVPASQLIKARRMINSAGLLTPAKAAAIAAVERDGGIEDLPSL